MLLAVACVCANFLYVDRVGARSLLTRWKPQTAAGNLVSVTGVERYARARIELERDETMGAFYDPDPGNLFVVCHTDDYTTFLEAVVWCGGTDDRVACTRFRAFRAWYARSFPDATLVGDHLSNDADRVRWISSGYDI